MRNVRNERYAYDYISWMDMELHTHYIDLLTLYKTRQHLVRIQNKLNEITVLERRTERFLEDFDLFYKRSRLALSRDGPRMISERFRFDQITVLILHIRKDGPEQIV